MVRNLLLTGDESPKRQSRRPPSPPDDDDNETLGIVGFILMLLTLFLPFIVLFIGLIDKALSE
jgi:hypothetical protein